MGIKKGQVFNKLGVNRGKNTVTPIEATERAEEVIVDREAKELYNKLFANKYNVLARESLMVPNYLQLICKDKFYKNGGVPTNAYTVKGYAKLMEVPEKEVANWVETNSEFFVWLHERIPFKQEVEFLILNLARQLYNDFPTASVKDKTAALNALAKFSSLQKPEKEEDDDIKSFFANMQDPGEIREYISRELGVDTFDEDEIYASETPCYQGELTPIRGE